MHGDSTSGDGPAVPAERRVSARACHRCGGLVGASEHVGRRDTCLQCGADLHCCLNCAFYDPTRHNQCREPQAERQVDKQAGNFCEYFSFSSGSPIPAASANTTKARLAALFARKK